MSPILISKYLAGECSAEERKHLLAWVKADEKNAVQFEKCRKIWQEAETIDYRPETDLAWNRLKLRLESSQSLSKQPKKQTLILRLARVAAVLIPILMITWYIVNDRFVQLAEVSTSKGERKQITLSDGTVVWLNSESSLKYPTTFKNTEKREVYLNGEAYFKVSADSNNLFVVTTEKVSAKAYGTSFNVSGYPEQEEIVVALDEGKLAVETAFDQKEVTIHPGQRAIIDKDDQKIALDLAGNEHNQWIADKIVFENENLDDVVITLERWYNTHIQIQNDKLKNCRFTGTFSDRKLEEILEVLKEALNIQIEKKKDTFYISGEGC